MVDRNAASIVHKDSSLRVHQGCWIQRCRGLLVAVFVTDAGVRVLAGLSVCLGNGNVCLTGKLDLLFERQAWSRGRQEDWIDCSTRMLNSVLALNAGFIVCPIGLVKSFTGILDWFFDSDAGWSVWLETWIQCSTRMLNWLFDRDAGLCVWHGCCTKCLKARLGGFIDRAARLSV